MVAIVSDRFHPAPHSKVLGSRPNPRVQILTPEYLGTYALLKDGGCTTGHDKAADDPAGYINIHHKVFHFHA
jgi:hypothetical protein